MNSLEINKFIAAVLLAVILIVVVRIVADNIYGSGEPEESAEVTTASAEGTPTEEAAATMAEIPDEVAAPVVSLADASPARGQRAFRRCQTCHSVAAGEGHRVGPNLYGVVGAPLARHDDFSYSPALADSGGEWTVERLDEFLADPANSIPGNRMPFAGIADAGERADLIAYLNSESDSPLELSSAEEPEG